MTPAIAPAANWYWKGRAELAICDGEYTFGIWRGHGDSGVDSRRRNREKSVERGWNVLVR